MSFCCCCLCYVVICKCFRDRNTFTHTQRERSFIHYFTPQRVLTTTEEPNQSLEPEISSVCPIWVPRDQSLRPFSISLSMAISRDRNQQWSSWNSSRHPYWHASVTNSGFSLLHTPAPICVFKKVSNAKYKLYFLNFYHYT